MHFCGKHFSLFKLINEMYVILDRKDIQEKKGLVTSLHVKKML